MRKLQLADVASVMRQGLTKSLAALLIKMATAGLTYLMFVVLSRTMGTGEYGLFAFGFALATMLSIAAGVGQQTAILRFWPEEEGAGRPQKALNALTSGWALVVLAGLALTGGLWLVAWILGFFGEGPSMLHLYAAALLILPMAAAEYGSSALRAQGSVWTALMPRDILWRFLVPVTVGVLAYFGFKLSGVQALSFTAAVLAFAVVVQFIIARARGYRNQIGLSGLGDYWRERGKASRWFLIGTVMDSAALNIDIVLVGLFVVAESAGLYFNAFRTAGLMTLFMFAITLVIAPMVSKHFHAGEIRKAQAVTTLCSWAGFLFSLGVFGVFFFFGDFILSLFGETYADGWIVLIILSLGLLVDAITGPTRIVMMMTGHERAYVVLFGSIMGVGILAQFVVIPMFGIVGAAVVNAGSRAIAQIVIAVWSWRKIGLETSLAGLWILLRRRGDGAAGNGD